MVEPLSQSHFRARLRAGPEMRIFTKPRPIQTPPCHVPLHRVYSPFSSCSASFRTWTSHRPPILIPAMCPGRMQLSPAQRLPARVGGERTLGHPLPPSPQCCGSSALPRGTWTASPRFTPKICRLRHLRAALTGRAAEVRTTLFHPVSGGPNRSYGVAQTCWLF